jgi:hypothetical protein
LTLFIVDFTSYINLTSYLKNVIAKFKKKIYLTIIFN